MAKRTTPNVIRKLGKKGNPLTLGWTSLLGIETFDAVCLSSKISVVLDVPIVME